ncbi:MAG TPA: hypothetical protein ENN29_05230, partial [Candidatus Hydrogenedentes bacterium]|nr:hypothetical protein [Candidatus Hydrogenedentota bacterium]
FITPDTNVYHGEASGPPLGVLEDAVWSDGNHILEPGSTVLYFTDGVVRARPPEEGAEEFGLARLWGVPEYSAVPTFLIEDVNNATRSYTHGAEPRDDCAMIALRYLGYENPY